MSRTTSDQVKVLSYAVFIIGAVISLFWGIMTLATNVLLGIIIIALGLAVSYGLAIIIDAIAQILENTQEIKQKLNEQKKQD